MPRITMKSAARKADKVFLIEKSIRALAMKAYENYCIAVRIQEQNEKMHEAMKSMSEDNRFMRMLLD